ncbi:flagellar biosynthesis anti-sigma factor FlgM [Bacillaceae bacterium CLA-AA-H227]|uniref:Flagellar biosynthesis anti-sigma factor FlgM n=1 Tax=Robertmurraya yapensis (ex Hitch et al 2024) TaxID=3133160 RepID=A0ACC6SBU1_9BACI
MKINNYGTSGINPYKRQMNKLENTNKTTTPSADKVEISTTAKEMQHVNSIAVERQEKVEQLKIQVENGSYKVNAQTVANKLVNFYKI